MTDWNVIRTLTGYENSVAWAFRQKENIEAYCPYAVIKVRKNGMRAPQPKEIPLLPSYIFTKGLPEFAIGFCKGYAGPLLDGPGKLAKIAAHEVESLMEREASGEFMEVRHTNTDRWFDMDEGSTVRAIAMPFEGWAGIVEEVRSDGMKVRINGGDFSRPVDFYPWQIERVNKPVELKATKG